MFLDEELSKIHEENGFSEKTSVKLMYACFNRIPNPDKLGSVQDWLNEVRKTENGWKLFCKSHPQYREEGFRLVAKKMWGDIENVDLDKIYKRLGW